MSEILLTNEWTKQTMARAVPGAFYDRDEKSWMVEDPTPRSAAVISRLFPELLDKYPELGVLRDTLLQDARPFDNATPFDQPLLDAAIPVIADLLRSEGKALYKFQALDLGYIRAVLLVHRAGYIAWERGLGKTIAALSLAESLGADRLMIVAPNTAKLSVWQEALETYMPDREVLVCPNSTPKAREKMVERIATEVHGPFAFVVHYEALALIAATRANRRGWDRLGEWDLVVCDEAHRLANPQTQLHRALMKVPAAKKLALSGSLIMNHPEEIYGVLNWLFPKAYRSKWRDWNDRFLEYVDSGWGRILIGPKPDRVMAMRKELGIFTCYRRKADELDLPDKTEQTLRVEISPAQRRAYNELRDTLVTTLDDGATVAALEPIVLLTRLRQVATGLELLSGKVADSAKLDLAVEMVRDNPDDPFVIFSWYKSAANAIAARLRGLGESVYLVTGDTPHTRRATYIREFQEGRGRVFVGTISTLGESVNLHRASQAIFLDRSWNPAANEQAADRIYRIGQQNPVTVTYLVARDTVDELKVLPALNTKEQIRRMILGGI